MPGETNYWYSFNAGLFHIVGYSTEIVIEPYDISYPYWNMVET